ncbi:hypothetical protein EV361DRAFT_598789 [Lentinula raphanica]|nr:hypothetical protein EV361DRAFT_598789 [Lentinula raphanica]
MLSSRIILALFLVLGTAVAVPLPQYDGSGYGDYETPQPPIVGRPRPQPGRTSSMSTTKFLGMMGICSTYPTTVKLLTGTKVAPVGKMGSRCHFVYVELSQRYMSVKLRWICIVLVFSTSVCKELDFAHCYIIFGT